MDGKSQHPRQLLTQRIAWLRWLFAASARFATTTRAIFETLADQPAYRAYLATRKQTPTAETWAKFLSDRYSLCRGPRRCC